MDAYLDEQFAHYTGVPELIEACLSRNILFMINTTGSRGYFQRVFFKKLLPRVSALSAHPGLIFPAGESDPKALFDLQEISDKPVNTALAARNFQIPPQNILVMGDSGGDGPHFKWASDQNAIRVASMAKPSLKLFCARTADRDRSLFRYFLPGRGTPARGRRDAGGFQGPDTVYRRSFGDQRYTVDYRCLDCRLFTAYSLWSNSLIVFYLYCFNSSSRFSSGMGFQV